MKYFVSINSRLERLKEIDPNISESVPLQFRTSEIETGFKVVFWLSYTCSILTAFQTEDDNYELMFKLRFPDYNTLIKITEDQYNSLKANLEILVIIEK